jgi:hypothetical protein
VALLVLAFAAPAFATTPKSPDPAPTAEAEAAATAEAEAAASATGGANHLTMGGDRTTAVALSNGAAIPPQCPPGLVPGKGKHRAHNSPLYGISAVCVAPDEEQHYAMQVVRDHEIKLAELAIERLRAEAARDRAAAERDRTATERIRADTCRTECLSK